MLILPFVPVTTAAVTARLLRTLHSGNGTPVLDLEDGQWDLDIPSRTPARKAAARENLLALCRLPRRHLPSAPVGLRLNPVSSPEFALDLPVARHVEASLGLRLLFLAKVESPDDLRSARTSLRAAGVCCDDLIPLVESEAGLRQLPGILAEAGTGGTSSAAYGYYDHSLERGDWPFRPMTEKPFWEVVSGFVHATQAAGMRFIFPPPAWLHATNDLRLTVQRLRQLAGDAVSIFSAGVSQTKVLQALAAESLPPNPLPPPPAPARPNPAEALHQAAEIVALHAANQRGAFSFAADRGLGRFIPPHELLAARRFLENSVHA